jgi:hypothetical protein
MPIASISFSESPERLPRSVAPPTEIYRNRPQSWKYGKEAPQNFWSERATIAARQGVSENENYETKPTQPDSNFGTDFGIRQLVEDVAKRCFIELAVSLAIGAVAAAFTASLLHASLIFAAIAVQTVSNAAFRTLEALVLKMPPSKETEWIKSACPYLCTTFFAYLTAFNAQILFHEAGHRAAAIQMFRNANPETTLMPCLGGSTQFSTADLTTLGQSLGKSKAMLIVTLMGPLSSLLISGVALAVGYAIRNKFPELGRYLIGVGRGDFYAHSFYALSALSASPGPKGHDFLRLRTYGLHPLAAATAILAVPLLLHLAATNPALKNSFVNEGDSPLR